MKEIDIVFGNKSKQFCINCESSYFEDGEKYLTCENDHFKKIPLEKAKMFLAVIFDCEDYVEIC